MHSKNGWHFLERCGCYWKTWSLWVWAHFAPTHIFRRSKVFSLSRYPSVIAQRCIENNWIVFVSSIYNISQSNIFVHWCAYRELCDCIFVIFYSIFHSTDGRWCSKWGQRLSHEWFAWHSQSTYYLIQQRNTFRYNVFDFSMYILQFSQIILNTSKWKEIKAHVHILSTYTYCSHA